MTKIGIVGCGYWGAKHIRSLHELGAAEIVVCDSDAERLANVQRKYPGLVTTDSFDRLLEFGTGGIIIATPMATHYQLARRALMSGHAVLVEKPLTTDIRHAEELVELAEAYETVLMVGHTFVYSPAVEVVRDLIASGELGDIYYIDTSRLNLGLFQQDASVLWDLAPHDLSMLVHMLDAFPTQVSAWGAAHVNRRLVDNAHVDLTFPGGTRAHIHVSWLEPCKVRRTTVVGTRKMVVYDDVAVSDKVWVYDKGITLNYRTDNFDDFHLSYRHGHTTILHTSAAEPLQVEQMHFIECINQRRRPRSDGFAGLGVVALLEYIQQSLSTRGSVVEVPEIFGQPPAHLGSGRDLISQMRATRAVHRNGVAHELVGEPR